MTGAPTLPSTWWQPEGVRLGWLMAYARQVPGHPAKVRLLRLLVRLLPEKIARHPDGGRMLLDCSDYIDWALLTVGHFEPASLAAVIDLMRPGGVLVDVGANSGLYTIAVAAATRCAVVAVEPEPANFARLLANLALNPDLAVTPVNCCATPAAMLVQLEAAPAGHGAWTHVRRGPAAVKAPRSSGLTLATILGDLQIGAVRVLKIDIEGYEPEALSGLDWKGPHRPQHVLMECDPTDTLKLAFMHSRNYTARTVTGGDPAGLTRYPEGNLLFSDNLAR